MMAGESEREKKEPRRRWPASVTYWVYQYLKTRDGEKCRICGVEPPEKPLEIDHINGDPNDWSETNLRLLCKSCNVKEWHRRLKSSVSEREKMGVGMYVDREGGVERESPELRIAREKEGLYRAWVLENVNRPQGLTFWEAVYEGAEAVGISPITARRYLYKMLSPSGPLYLGEGPRGHRRVLLKEGFL